MPHQLVNLKRYDLIRDACLAAEVKAGLYGDPYVVIECGGGNGFAAVRESDVPTYQLQPWQIHSTWSPDLQTGERRRRLNEFLQAAFTTEEVAAS